MDADKIREILNRRKSYSSGTQIINCMSHMHLDWNKRPTDCELCSTDKSNFISYVLCVNKFVNKLCDEISDSLSK